MLLQMKHKLSPVKKVLGESYRLGDWVYFLHEVYRSDRSGDLPKGQIYRVNLEGTKLERLSEELVTDMAISDSKIVYSYYGNFLEGGGIERGGQYYLKSRNANGEDPKIITKEVEIFNLDAKDGWVYFTNYSDEEKLYRIRLDGSMLEKLSNEPFYY